MVNPTWASNCGTVKLWLGDCLEVMKTWPAGVIDIVVSDPPYGHNNNNDDDLVRRREAALGCGSLCAARPITNDSGVEAGELYRTSLRHWHRLLKPGCCCCCCIGGGGGSKDLQFATWSLWMDEVFSFKEMVIWDKGPMGMGWHYRRSYEAVLVGEKPGGECQWYGGRNTENIIRPGDYGIRKIIPKADQHPCAKPNELYGHFIELHTQSGGIVLDPLMGEGPCGVAAVRLGRSFWGIEIDRGYFERAKRRIEDELERTSLLGCPAST